MGRLGLKSEEKEGVEKILTIGDFRDPFDHNPTKQSIAINGAQVPELRVESENYQRNAPVRHGKREHIPSEHEVQVLVAI